MKIKTILAKYKKSTLFMIKVIFVFLPIIIIANYLQNSWGQLNGYIASANWPLLMVAVTLFLVYFLLRAAAWQLTINSLGQPLGWRSATHIWFWSEFSRYLPGNIWSVIGRVYLGQQRGIPKKTIATSLLLEIIFLVSSAAIFFGFFCWWLPYYFNPLARWLWAAVIPIIVLLISPDLLIRLINHLAKLLKQSPVDLHPSRGALLGLLLIYLFGWFFYGSASFVIMKALFGQSTISFWWLISAFVTAWLVGYLSFITPMGLGIREAAVVVILSPIISVASAGLIAIATRVVSIVSELFIIAVLAAAHLFFRSFLKYQK